VSEEWQANGAVNAIPIENRDIETAPYANIAAYKFVALDQLPQRREALKQLCRRLSLRGTILLSPEGINMFLAGTQQEMKEFLSTLRADACFTDLEVKFSYSDHQPFHRMLVKLKREIIAFDQDGIDPVKYTSKRVSAKQLKEWLGSGKEVVLLDTRNIYEVQLGTFQNAVDFGISHFKEFPDKAREFVEANRDKTIVSFCTGGIRCEKAAPFLEQVGFQDVYQLDGGILKYFEECGSAHYDGSCFVFDQRVALDPALQPTGNVQCFACQAVLSADDLQSEQYQYGKSCPHCYLTQEERTRQLLRQREAEFLRAVTPLPGSQPYVNRRFIHVPGRLAGLPMMEFLTQWYPPYGEVAWREAIESGRITSEFGKPTTIDQMVREGERFIHVVDEAAEPDVSTDVRFVYEDQFFVVVDKPAPLPTHPSGRFNRNTLSSMMEPVYRPQKLRVTHRLDANTTGLVVLARTFQAASALQPQFQNGTVEKVYLARLQGTPESDHFRCDVPISREPGAHGSRQVDEDGLPSSTLFEVIERLADGTTLVEVRPLQGRTNQIRIHAWHLGFPIVGDPLYLPGGQMGEQQTLAVSAPPMCLHAWRLSFVHPETKERVHLTATRDRTMFA
jgi:RluA family pseudouridine synthase